MKKPIIGNTVGTPYKSVPRMSVLDKKEDWFAEPQKEFPRVYAESAENQDPNNKFFLTQEAVAPVDPNGQAAVFGKGLYFTSAAESERWSNLSNLSKIKTNSADSSYVSIKSDGTWCVCSTNEDTVDREIWMMPTGWNIFNSSKRKAVVEFDIKFDEFTVLSGENADFTFKIAPMFYKTYSTGVRAITTSSSAESALLLFVTKNSIRVKANGIEEKEYSINPKTMFNFRLALCGDKYSLYINDYLMVTGNTIADTRECYSLNRMGIILNKKVSTKFSMNNLFCGVVDGDELYSGRYLDSVAGRRKNKHILVPGKLSDYKDYAPDGLSAEEYALSYGAAKDWLEKQDRNITKSVPRINLNHTSLATGEVTARAFMYVGATGTFFGAEHPTNGSYSTQLCFTIDGDKSRIYKALKLQFNGEEFGIYGEHYLPAATSDKMGGIKSGGDITVNADGTVKINMVPETSGNDITIEKVTPKVTFKNKSAESTTPDNLGVIGADSTGTYISANNPSTGDKVTRVIINTSDNPTEAISLKHKTETYKLYGQHNEPVATDMSLGFVRSGDDISVNAAGQVTVKHAAEATTATKADSVNAQVFAGYGYAMGIGDENFVGTLSSPGYYLLMFNFDIDGNHHQMSAIYDSSSSNNGYLRVLTSGISLSSVSFCYRVDKSNQKLYLKLVDASASVNQVTYDRTFAIKLNF